MKSLLLLFLFLISTLCFASTEKVVHVYAWGGEIPQQLIHRFEHATGIKVRFSSYDSNETLYTKLKTSQHVIYDVILPSAYYIERMRKQNMLTKLDLERIPNRHNIAKAFINKSYDPSNHYSIPLIWGATGIFYNQKHSTIRPKAWTDLWQAPFVNELMLYDDAREIFSMALLSLGFSANDQNPKHIQQAYQRLLQLIPNIKLFSSDAVQAIMIDEDVIAGTSWGGDALKAHAENPAIQFVYPQEGFVAWVDCLAIPKGAQHLSEAYAFINFLLEAESGEEIALYEGHAITNEAAIARLPVHIRNNPMIYPNNKTMQRAQFQRDVNDETLNLYASYWQQLKLAL